MSVYVHEHFVSSRLLQTGESQPELGSGWTGMSITTHRCSSTRHQGRRGTGCSCWMACFRQRQYMDLFRAFTQLRVYLALPRLSTECARNPCLYFEALYLSVCGVRRKSRYGSKVCLYTLLLNIQSHENVPRLNIVRD